MSKLFALFAIVVILCGVLVLAGPFLEPDAASRSLSPQAVSPAMAFLGQVREMAESVQAPLSIVFGVISLYWNRKNYMKQQRAG
jgi:hypothetical protein